MSTTQSNCSDSSSEYEPEYEIESIVIAEKNQNITFDVLTVVPPPLEYMSSLHSAQQEISGRRIWCGSKLLSEFLLHKDSHHTEIDGTKVSFQNYFFQKRILELGSGTGIVGMTIATQCQPKCVALTDGDEETVNLLIQNLDNKSNHCFKEENPVASGAKLLWGMDGEGEGGYVPFCQFCQSQWPHLFPLNTEDGEEDGVMFDCILAGDVLYKKDLPTLFFSTIQRFLTKDGVLYLCHVPRADVTQQVVKDAANEANFKWEEIDITDVKQDLVETDDDIYRACIYRISF